MWLFDRASIFNYKSILDIIKLTLVFPWQVFPYHTYIFSHHVSNILDELDYISLWIDNTYKAIEKFCTCSNRFFSITLFDIKCWKAHIYHTKSARNELYLFDVNYYHNTQLKMYVPAINIVYILIICNVLNDLSLAVKL